MSQQLEPTRSPQQAGLTTLSNSVIIREQNSLEVIKRLAHLINRLGRLYMIKDWREENAVDLAEWVSDEYGFEPMGLIETVLKNPPVTKNYHGDEENNWKLTPDTIRRWMADSLEKQAAKREAEHQRLKESFNDPLQLPPKPPGEMSEKEYKDFYNQFYGGFIQRQEEGTALREVKSDPWLKGDDAYNKFRAARVVKKDAENKDNSNGEEKTGIEA